MQMVSLYDYRDFEWDKTKFGASIAPRRIKGAFNVEFSEIHFVPARILPAGEKK